MVLTWPVFGAVIGGLSVCFGLVLWWVRQTHQAQIQALEDKQLLQLAKQANDHRDHLKRRDREQARALQRASFGLVGDLLPGLDALAQAIASADIASSPSDDETDASAIIDGLTMVEKALVAGLAAHEVTPISPTPGEAFDPMLHEAIGVVPTDAVAPGSIFASLRPGWQHPAGLLRPAMVQTATALPPAPPQDDVSSSDEAPTSEQTDDSPEAT